MVFQDRTLALADLNRILLDDFKGQERIRQLLLNKPPKYGNDNDFVDGLARRIVSVYADELGGYRDSRGGKYVLSILSQSFNVLQGKSLGATPDGRGRYEGNTLMYLSKSFPLKAARHIGAHLTVLAALTLMNGTGFVRSPRLSR